MNESVDHYICTVSWKIRLYTRAVKYLRKSSILLWIFYTFLLFTRANDVNFESENRPTRSISFVFPYFRFSFSVIDLLAANFAKMKIFSHANWIGNYARSGKTSAVCNAGFLKSAIYKAVSFFARMPRK